MTKIERRIKHVRGPVGTAIKWLFIGFNLLMLFWLFSYWGDVAPIINNGSGAAQAGAAIGSTIGTGLILMFWVLGTIVLGIPVLLTKGKLVEIEEIPEPVQTAQIVQDKVIISEIAAQKYAEEPRNMVLHPKSKSLLTLILQYSGFALFLLVGIGMIFDSFLSGLGIILAGSLLLPQIQIRLASTPLKNPIYTGLTMLAVVILTTIIGTSSNTENKEEKPQALQQDLKKEAEEAFSKNPEKALEEIKQYKGNNWGMVKIKTEILLGTNNPEIQRLHEEATIQLAKQEEESKKQIQEQLASEFKEKRTALIADLKKEISNGNYGHAQSIGANYVSIADKEFKDLHESAVEKQKAEASAAPWSYSQNDDPMSKGKTYHASLMSSNTVQFGFPYSGAQHGTLTLRIDPKYGKDVIFSIEKGQILCHSYQDCTVRVRFDEENAVSYSAVGAADNWSTPILESTL